MTPSAAGARAYHDATKHSWHSVRHDPHVLDWETKPFPFKIYPDLEPRLLPREVAPPALPALTALRRVTATPGAGQLDLPTLGQLLFFSAGITKRKVYPGGHEVHFRAAATTGALYQTEVYVVAGAVDGLEPGVYHFGPGDFALRRLRAGDYRAALADHAGEPETIRDAAATLVVTAIYWRNTWKYRSRGYRHFFWDAGTLLANVLAVAVAADLPARVLLGFADDPVNRLLAVDPAREGSLALVPLGRGAGPPAAPPPVPTLTLATVALSPREVDYPLVREAYRASSLDDGTAARGWVSGWPGGRRPGPPEPDGVEGPPLGEVVLRRGSTRQFARVPIDREQLDTLLETALRPLPLDAATRPPAPALADTYLLLHAVEGPPPGAYVYDNAAKALRELRRGDLRAEGGHLCLDQPLGADASAVVFFLAALDPLVASHGERAYRAVNLVAGLLGGRLYLAAYALGLGATGLTFYDDDVVQAFSPHAAGKDAIFVTALGRAPRPARPRGPAPVAGDVRPLTPGEGGWPR